MRWNVHQKRIERHSHSRPSFKNPLFTKRSWQQFVIERLSIFAWILILGGLGIVYLLFYSPLLQINRIEIKGTVSIPAETLDEKFVRWQLDQRRFLIFKQSNILLFNKSWLTENILNQFSTDSLVIDKKLPHTLIVTIVEKKPQLIWQTGEQQLYLGEQGIVSSTVSSVDVTDDVPTVTDESGEAVSPGDTVLSQDRISFITSLISQSGSWMNVTVTGYSITSKISVQFNVHTEAGYDIYFDMSRDLDQQIEKLNRVLETKIQEEQPSAYVDLRIGDRVYIK